jgi:ATP-dependent helicase Lhr and Lhr-like helicase
MTARTLEPRALHDWFASRGWEPFAFQREVWAHYRAGRSGLLHAPTGTGKTLAVWGGPLIEALETSPAPVEGDLKREHAEPARVVWLTPLRALATDTAHSLAEPVAELGLPWTIELRTGDTTQSLKAKQRTRLPTALVTTPESLTLLLSYADARRAMRTIRAVVVDEWHELMSSKRGVQAELALARLRMWNPGLRTWGLSATLGNLDEAREALVGRGPHAEEAALVTGRMPKKTRISTVLPADVERFPWAGHLGTNLLEPVLESIAKARSTLLFTNTRSQTELWFRAITYAKPEWLGEVAIHHGSLDRDVRNEVEDRLRAGSLRCVVCTSSLDLGVDFSPVDQVIQVGSPKGIARLLQRAGRSGHSPGRTSAVLCVPAHAFELVEFAAARDGAKQRDVEPRPAIRKPLDVLVQHLVTIGAGGGFTRAQLHDEVRTTHAFSKLTDEEFGWTMDFLTRGGAALGAYPEYQRLKEDGERFTASDDRIVRRHRMGIGTITADTAIAVKFGNGQSLGHIEESFVARLTPGDRFVFAGRVLELERVREMTAWVKTARSKKGIVPRWQGGRSPLSTKLAARVRERLDQARRGLYEGPEMRAVRPMLELQLRWSTLPAPGELLVETTTTRSGAHTFVFPFRGRLVHEGLGALLAHRIARTRPATLDITANDYGIELRSAQPLRLDADEWPTLLTQERLLEDLLECVNESQLARRRFRDIARIAGLINTGFPGSGKSNRQLQASSELFFDVFSEFDPSNLLLDQAKREVLEQQLELQRMRTALDELSIADVRIIEAPHLTPLSFPLWAESLRAQHISSEQWKDRIGRMVLHLEEAAGDVARAGATRG